MEKDKKYVSLHTHSTYSPQDGIGIIRDMLQACKDKGIQSLAITDHGNCNHFGDLYLQAKEFGVKPIYGNEFYFVPSLKEMWDEKDRAENDKSLTGEEKKDIRHKIRKNYHLTILAKNKKGLENLFILTYLSYKNGFYYKPRIDRELLQQYSEGLICSSGCLAGEIQRNLITNKYDLAKEAAKFYRSVFGDDFYLEMQMNEMDVQRTSNEGIIQLSQELNIPTILTNDNHYIGSDDAAAQQTLLLLQSKQTYGDKEKGKGFWEFGCKQLYMKNYSDMQDTYNQFAKDYMPVNVFLESMENTLRVDEKIENIEVDTSPKLPTLDEKPMSKLIQYCKQGLLDKGLSKNKKYIDRLKFELEVIKEKGFANYFLICREIINNAKKEMLVGSGRGSACGSLVVYLLGITEIDPIRFDLYFERFLNIHRDDYPDIDSDFENVDSVKEWIKQHFGEENVAFISTFGTFKMKNLIKDLCRVYEHPLTEANALCKKIDEYVDIIYPGSNKSIVELKFDDYYSKCPEFKKFMDKYPLIQRDFKVLVNQIRHVGKHAGGVVICDDVYKKMPTIFQDGNLQTGVTEGLINKNLGKLGFVKFDILGLSTLEIIHNTAKLIEKERGVPKNKILHDISTEKLDLNIKEVYRDIFLKGRTAGIFQFGSDGMNRLLKKSNVDCFEDITAVTALYRPGPLASGMADEFGERKKEKDKIQYKHPIEKKILQNTYGILCYQESLMALGHELGGLTLSETNDLRKVIIKQSSSADEKKIKLREELKIKFFQGCIEKGLTEEQTNDIWKNMEAFAGYGFNRSHAVAYTVTSYQTAYLKKYYPTEFYTALFNFAVDKNDEKNLLTYITEARKSGIQILPVDINKSEKYFSIEGDKIRLGFMCLKGIGSNACETIVEARNKIESYTNLPSFFENKYIEWRKVNKKVITILIQMGAFDKIEKNRKMVLEAFEQFKASGKKPLKVKNSVFLAILETIECESYSDIELGEFESKHLGFNYFYDPFIINQRDKKIYLLESLDLATNIKKANKNKRLTALIIDKREHKDKNGRTMAFLKVKDNKNNEIDLTVFGQVYPKLSEKLKVGNVGLFRVKKNTFNEKETFILNTPFEPSDRDINNSVLDIDDKNIVKWLKSGNYENFN